MRYWWVNHKQTFKQELDGGYIWSPKTKRGGGKNLAYTNLTYASPGEIIFSFANAKIQAIGIIAEKYIEAEQPTEFGKHGDQWDQNGYFVKVVWTRLQVPFRVKDNISEIGNYLPNKYSPVRLTGDGNQGTYLAEISKDLTYKLIELIEADNKLVEIDLSECKSSVEEQLEENLIKFSSLPITVKEQLIKARIGQGRFKENVSKIEGGCRLTGVREKSFLIASHIFPWSKSNNDQKLDGHNGLLLSPHADKLFDRGYLSFDGDGKILLKATAYEVFRNWRFNIENVGSFNDKQKEYLALHRKHNQF